MKAYTAIIERCPDTNLFILRENGDPIVESEYVGTQMVIV